VDDAAASLEIDLTEDEVAELEAPYTPRADLQGVCDDAELGRISPKLGIKPASSSPVPPPARRAHRPRQCPQGLWVMQNTKRALEVGQRTRRSACDASFSAHDVDQSGAPSVD
jgi:hypothetical protein